MMNNDKMQNMAEMMNKTSESERMMMDKMTGMCMCHDCSTFKDCSMNTDCSPTPSMTSSSMTSCMDPAMTSKKGLFCGMEGSMVPSSCLPQKMECMCTTCSVASDMGMDMTAPCMTKK
jgi:hypothetical protein